MGSVGIIQAVRDSVVGHADVRTLYGQPIEAQGKTIIPVARIWSGRGQCAWVGEFRRWRWRWGEGVAAGRDRGYAAGDEIHSDFRSEKAGGCSAGGHGAGLAV